MPLPFFEVPAGAIDNVNDTFTVSRPYTAGTAVVYYNGQLISFSAYVESDPANGEVRITASDCIPRSGVWGTDTIHVFYLDTSTDVPFLELQPLTGIIQGPAIIDGTIDPIQLHGEVLPAQQLTAIIESIQLGANIEPASQLTATIEECD